MKYYYTYEQQRITKAFIKALNVVYRLTGLIYY